MGWGGNNFAHVVDLVKNNKSGRIPNLGISQGRSQLFAEGERRAPGRTTLGGLTFDDWSGGPGGPGGPGGEATRKFSKGQGAVLLEFPRAHRTNQ